MAVVTDSTADSITIRMSNDEVAGLSNVINHALDGGFCIDERDCSSIVGLSWNELQDLWKVIRESRGLGPGIN